MVLLYSKGEQTSSKVFSIKTNPSPQSLKKVLVAKKRAKSLEAARFNPSGKDLAEQLSKSKDADTTTFHTPIDNPSESIAQKNENIPQSNPHIGAGLLGGSLNGIEQDEEGNLSFDPAKFAAGFLGASLGSKAASMGFKHLEKPSFKRKNHHRTSRYSSTRL